METAILILALVFISMYQLMIIKHEVHMFQQNSYMHSRYIRWFIGKGDLALIYKGAPGLISVVLLVLGQDISAFIFALVYYSVMIVVVLKKKEKEKKKLVYTNRVKRLFAVLILVFGLSIFVFVQTNVIVLFIYIVIMSSLPQILLIISAAIILPFEELISLYYINDAKKKMDKHKNLKVVGITGSYGKTSTKYILNEILKLDFNVLMTPESYNTTLGVVRTIRERLGPLHEVFIVEMGAKKRRDIEKICRIVKPTYGILTTIGPQHLETFKSLENIIKTKFELYDSIPSYGMAFINKDDKIIMDNLKNEQTKYVFYSMHTKDSDYYLYDVLHTRDGIRFMVRTIEGEEQEFFTKLLGRHNLYNILSAICCANILGVSLENISHRVAGLKSVEHRLELKKKDDRSIIIDDAYNSNPEGAKEALNVLKSFREYQKILITPGMIELGEKQDELNREFGKYAAAAADQIILVGKKQTVPIYEGIRSAGYDMQNCYVAKDLDEAVNKMEEIRKDMSVILFENDLPDIYN